MTDLKLNCDNCGSSFALSFEEDEVSYTPSHCPFCGDFYDNTSEELDFSEDDEETFFDEEIEDDEDENLRRH